MTRARELAELGSVYDNGALSNRNMIINGAMLIDQRNDGASVTVSNGVDTFCPDRFRFTENHSGTFTIQQVSDAPVGFEKSSKITVTGTDSSLAASEFARILQGIEGKNISHLNWGSANAKTCTLSFYVKSSVTGQYYVSINNGATNRNMLKGYTIDAANTWEKKTIQIIGDTTGTWLTTNGGGIFIMWTLGTGSTFQSSTTDSYQSGFFMGKSDQINLAATNSATWQLTGVQLEVGTEATPFEVRDDELERCYRYFESKTFNTFIGVGYANIATTAHFPFPYLEKRAAPTITLPTAGQGSNEVSFLKSNGSFPSTTGTNTALNATKNQARIQGGSYSGLTAEGPSALFVNGEASVTIDAEL